MNNYLQNKSKINFPNKKFLWFVFLFAILIYNFIGILIMRSEENFTNRGFINMEINIFNLLFYAFIVFSIIQFIVLLKLNSKIKNEIAFPKLLLEKELKKNCSIRIITYSLADLIAVYGLALFLMNGEIYHLFLFSGIAMLGMFIIYPRK